MCNLSEGILEEGWTKGITQGRTEGVLQRSQQVILDLLEDLETLRRWHKAAARTESFPAFREIMATACGA